MANDFIRHPDDSAATGKKLRTNTRTGMGPGGTDTVHETYGMVIDETSGNAARVLNAAPASTDYGLVVRRVDPARTPKTIYGAALSLALTTDTMLTTIAVTNFTAASGVSTGHPITTAKTFRLLQISGNVRMSTAAAHFGALRVRVNTGGAVTNASPVIFAITIPAVAALANTGFPFSAAIPEGYDIPASAGADVRVGISGFSSLAGTLLDVSLVGYEY